jgi:glycosyltransferase involved in cell wall biosynthesis
LKPPLHVVALMEAKTVTGPAKNLIRFSEAAAAEGSVRVTIVTFVRGAEQQPNQFISAVAAKGIEIQQIPERFAFDPRIFAQLRNLLHRLKPDVFQTHGVKGHFLARMLRTRIPWIAFHHGYTAEDLKMKLYNQLNRWSLPGADRVITVCQPFADDLRRSGVDEAHLRVLANSIEARPRIGTAEIQALRRQLGIGEEERVILAVGRFSPEKGHTWLIEAAAALMDRSAGNPFRLLLVGEGGERRAIERMVLDRGLKARTIFAGHQRDPWPYYCLADIFALPSLSEGSPNALLEAMTAGLPIVATSVGGVPETVHDGVSALLTPKNDPRAFSLALERLLADTDFAATLGRTALLRSADFSPAAYRSALSNIYCQLSAEKAGTAVLERS